MFKHLTESSTARAFLKECGCYVMKKSAHNAVTIKHRESGKELQLWAESDHSVAAGIPGYNRALMAYRDAEDEAREALNKFNERKALHALETRKSPDLKSVGQLLVAAKNIRAATKVLDSI